MRSFSSPADIEAIYRFNRNQSVSLQAIANAGFAAIEAHANAYDCLLALEDTTSLAFFPITSWCLIKRQEFNGFLKHYLMLCTQLCIR